MPATERRQRIPLALQAIFVASNRGEKVDKPPPGLANRRFRGILFWRREKKADNEADKTQYTESEDSGPESQPSSPSKAPPEKESTMPKPNENKKGSRKSIKVRFL